MTACEGSRDRRSLARPPRHAGRHGGRAGETKPQSRGGGRDRHVDLAPRGCSPHRASLRPSGDQQLGRHRGRGHADIDGVRAGMPLAKFPGLGRLNLASGSLLRRHSGHRRRQSRDPDPSRTDLGPRGHDEGAGRFEGGSGSVRTVLRAMAASVNPISAKAFRAALTAPIPFRRVLPRWRGHQSLCSASLRQWR